MKNRCRPAREAIACDGLFVNLALDKILNGEFERNGHWIGFMKRAHRFAGVLYADLLVVDDWEEIRP